MVEVRAVVDGGLLGWSTTKDLGFPGVQVRVEVKDSDGTISSSDAAEEWESNGV